MWFYVNAVLNEVANSTLLPENSCSCFVTVSKWITHWFFFINFFFYFFKRWVVCAIKKNPNLTFWTVFSGRRSHDYDLTHRSKNCLLMSKHDGTFCWTSLFLGLLIYCHHSLFHFGAQIWSSNSTLIGNGQHFSYKSIFICCDWGCCNLKHLKGCKLYLYIH